MSGNESENVISKVEHGNKDTVKDNLLNHLEISVVESEKRANNVLNLREFYTVYLVETKITDPAYYDKYTKIANVWRRYTEFEQLRDYLDVTYPNIVLAPLPEKRVLYAWQKISNDTFDPSFVDRRRTGLENFLLRIASHPVLGWDNHFMEFLQNESGWRESYKANGYMQLVESKLKALSNLARNKKSDPFFDESKEYSNTLYNNLSSLLKARARIVEKQYVIHKLHANYGRVFSEWSVIEKDMGDSLQRAGHYLDSYATYIEAVQEDEEVLADCLKEYLFFSTSLGNVCKQHELLQLELEGAEDNVANKNSERSKAQQGRAGFMSRLFGAVDTEEVRELRINVLDQQIEEGASAVAQTRQDLGEFTEKAKEDIQRFQTQKDADLKDILSKYAHLQLKASKKGLQTWIQIQECLQNIT